MALADAALLRHLHGSGGLAAQLTAVRGLFLLGAPAAADFATGLFALLEAGRLRVQTLLCHLDMFSMDQGAFNLLVAQRERLTKFLYRLHKVVM